MTPALSSMVTVVTGASRGIGKATALALGRAGATVYVTGRTANPGESVWPGTIGHTAEEINRLGGHGTAVQVDHADDDQVRALFDRIADEHGQLDLLVNNATGFGGTETGYPPINVPCWELPLGLWDELHQVGLRSHYVASVLAIPIMLPHRRGLIVNVSSKGAVEYIYGAAYGAAKAGLDKLTADLAHELQTHHIAVISLWPPLTATEKITTHPEWYPIDATRPPAVTGEVVAALAIDPDVIHRTGKALDVTELADEYRLDDSKHT